MKYLIVGLFAAFFLFTLTSCESSSNEASIDSQEQILVFSKTGGFRHDGSIETGQVAFQELGAKHNFEVTLSEDATLFNTDSLARYNAVVFLNTSGPIFNDEQKAAFENYIQNGGGYLGIHAASDTEYEWPWYNSLVGAYFDGHPPVMEAVIEVVDANHPATKNLPSQWTHIDEWYNFRSFNDDINVLLKLDTDSFEGSEHPGDHPIAWYHDYDGGRAFYTGLGHTNESFSDENFREHLRGGLKYVMGN